MLVFSFAQKRKQQCLQPLKQEEYRVYAILISLLSPSRGHILHKKSSLRRNTFKHFARDCHDAKSHDQPVLLRHVDRVHEQYQPMQAMPSTSA